VALYHPTIPPAVAGGAYVFLPSHMPPTMSLALRMHLNGSAGTGTPLADVAIFSLRVWRVRRKTRTAWNGAWPDGTWYAMLLVGVCLLFSVYMHLSTPRGL